MRKWICLKSTNMILLEGGFFFFLRTKNNNETERWFKMHKTQSFPPQKWKGLHRQQLLKNNLHDVVSILSSLPWNLIAAIHSALFTGMEENYFSRDHIKILMKWFLMEKCFRCTFICYNRKVFFILRVKNSWNNNLESEVFFLNNMKDGFAPIVSI